MDARLRQMAFQPSPKWLFYPLFHENDATDAPVGRTGTPESALEMFNDLVCGKKIFKFFATFFRGSFPLRFG